MAIARREESTSFASRLWVGRWEIVFWAGLLFVFLYVFPHLAFLKHANEMPRLFLSEALARDGVAHVDTQLREYGYHKQMDLSRSVCLGGRILEAAKEALRQTRLRSYRRRGLRGQRGSLDTGCVERTHPNKAPAQSYLGAVFYWMGERWAGVIGGEFVLVHKLWWLRLGTSLLPVFVLLVLVDRITRRWVPERAPRRMTVLALGLGSLMMVYGLQLMSHGLSACLLFASFYALCSGATGESPVAWRLVAAGFCAGAAIASDYQAGFGAVFVAAYGLYRVGVKPALIYGVVGGLGPLFFLGWYHQNLYGSPFWTGYEFLLAGGDQALHAEGVLGIVGPRPHPFWASMFSARDGLVFLSPWVVFAAVGLYRSLQPGTVVAHDAITEDLTPARKLAGSQARGTALEIWKLSGAALGGLSAALAVYRGAGAGAVEGSALALKLLGWAVVGWALLGMLVVVLPSPLSLKMEPCDGLGDTALGCAVVIGGLLSPVVVALAAGSVWSLGLPLFVSSWGLVGASGSRRGGGGWPCFASKTHRGLGIASLGLAVGSGALLLAGWPHALWGSAASWFRIAMWGAVGMWVWTVRASRTLEGEVARGLPLPVALSVFALVAFYIWFVSSVTFWHGGWQVGPRYLSVMLPFLALAAAVGFRWAWYRGALWSLVVATVAVGVVIYTLTSATFPHFPKSFKNPLFGLVGTLLSRGYVARNAGASYFGWRGVFSLWPYLCTAAALFLWVALGGGSSRLLAKSGGASAEAATSPWGPAGYRVWVWAVLGLLGAALILGVYSTLPKADFDSCCRWITKMWDRERGF